VKVEQAILKDGTHTAILFDDEFNIVEPVLIFTNWLQQKGMSPNTVISYVQSLKAFFEWLEIEGISFHQVKPAFMPRFIAYVDEQGEKSGQKAASTINRYLAAVSSMYRHFEVLGGYTDLNPLVTYKGKRPIEMGKSFLVHTVNKAQVDYSYFRLKNKIHLSFPLNSKIFKFSVDSGASKNLVT
jgi:integrase/recombinase XerD